MLRIEGGQGSREVPGAMAFQQVGVDEMHGYSKLILGESAALRDVGEVPYVSEDGFGKLALHEEGDDGSTIEPALL